MNRRVTAQAPELKRALRGAGFLMRCAGSSPLLRRTLQEAAAAMWPRIVESIPKEIEVLLDIEANGTARQRREAQGLLEELRGWLRSVRLSEAQWAWLASHEAVLELLQGAALPSN